MGIYGYRYDTETGLYYCQSRYYNPEWGRWLNADSVLGQPGQLLSHNLFAYCYNNPVNMADPNGDVAWWIVGGIVGAVAGAVIAGASTGWDWRYMAAGAAAGALVGVGAGALAQAAYAGIAGTGILGTLGATVVNGWQQAEKWVRNSIDGVSKAFQTPYGNRVVDSYNKANGAIAECKYGYVSLTNFVNEQLTKDYYLLSNGYVKSIEWHFFISQATGKGGPSDSLLKALQELGFKVIYH